MWIDGDVLDEIKSLAAKDHMKYQTWLNRKLRDVILSDSPTRWAASESSDDVEVRIKALERAVFKKRKA